MQLLQSSDPASVALSLLQRIQRIQRIQRMVLEAGVVEAVEAVGVVVAAVVEGAIMVIRRIEVGAVLGAEDVEDIVLGGGLVFIDRNRLDLTVAIDIYTLRIHFETPIQGSAAFALPLAMSRTIVTSLKNGRFISLKILGRVITVLRRKGHM
jgi:hypothetical protein